MYKCKRKPRRQICAAFRTYFKAAGLKAHALALRPCKRKAKRVLGLLFAKGGVKEFSFLFRTCLCLPRKADTENLQVSDPILYRELSLLRDSRLFHRTRIRKLCKRISCYSPFQYILPSETVFFISADSRPERGPCGNRRHRGSIGI